MAPVTYVRLGETYRNHEHLQKLPTLSNINVTLDACS